MNQVMNVSFRPELGQSLTIPISLAYTCTAELCFTATLDSQDYLQLQKDGAKVQLWSNFPAPGRTHGEWGEIDFADIPGPNPENAVSLLSTTRDQSHGHSIYLRISIPFAENTSKSYSYTYRIVYPAGETQWLGAFGHNGTITVQPTDEDQRISFLGDGWRRGQSTRVWDSSEGAATQAVAIAKLLQREDWTVWSIGVESILTDTKDLSLLFLVPCVSQSCNLFHPSTQRITWRRNGNDRAGRYHSRWIRLCSRVVLQFRVRYTFLHSTGLRILFHAMSPAWRVELLRHCFLPRRIKSNYCVGNSFIAMAPFNCLRRGHRMVEPRTFLRSQHGASNHALFSTKQCHSFL
ncbi:hypothetical protein BDZ89DRAFT_464828 [Hymenopellis radicata]|nr:hypothetical protein BDZ89DRAFT_464828 [Hymenopellis radicata]